MILSNSDTSIKDFYNSFDKRLILDYLNGNPRIEAAIGSLLRHVQLDGKTVLDIGCGIGWSSHEIAQYATQVLAVDLSSGLVEVGRRLFSKENISYRVLDVTGDDFQEINGLFDVVVLIDVFEHIPRSDRDTFIQSLMSLLAKGGILFLACPSVYHQDFLRAHHPDRLQPVDEDINIGDLLSVAKRLEGDLLYFKYESIWNANDYFHAIVQKGPVRYQILNQNYALENKSSRVLRVKKSGLSSLVPLNSGNSRLRQYCIRVLKYGLQFLQKNK